MKEGGLEKNLPKERFVRGRTAGRREWQKAPKRPPTEEGRPKRPDEFLPIEEIPDESERPGIERFGIPERIKEKLTAIIKEGRVKSLSEEEKEQLREDFFEAIKDSSLDDDEKESLTERLEQSWEDFEPTPEEIKPFLDKREAAGKEELKKESFQTSQEAAHAAKQEILKEKQYRKVKTHQSHGIRGREKRGDEITRETVRRKKPFLGEDL